MFQNRYNVNVTHALVLVRGNKEIIINIGRFANEQRADAGLDRILESYGYDQSNLIAILQEIQAEYKYLSEESLTLVAEKLGISAAKVYSVATFYENFSLEAKGKHIIKVCAGTACHVRKSQPIFDAVHDYLGLVREEKDLRGRMFTLETVACLGACGLAPVMTIDGEVHSKMTPEAALSLLEEIREKEASVHAAD